MFRVILYNWYDNNGVMHPHEIPIMVINPLTLYRWIDDNGNVLVDENGSPIGNGPILEEKPCMINPSIKEEMGKAPSFDFTVNPGMAYYNAYKALKTLIRIDYGTDWNNANAWKTIFFGRVITINTSSLRQVKSIHAEGLYTIFADTVQEGIEEDFQKKKTATQLFQEIIAQHNSQTLGEWWKQIDIGECNVPLDSESKKRDSSSWQTTQSALDQLISNNGGYMRVRIVHDDPNGRPFKLDWYRKYYRDLGPDHRPCFELAKNILDLSSTHEISEIFTRVIPIGHKASASGSSTSDSEYTNSSQKKERTMIYLEPRVINVESINPGTDEELLERFQSRDEFENAYTYYGSIYKTVNFPNAYNKDLLAQYANDWIKKNYYGALRSFSVKAVDMKMVGEYDSTDDIVMAGDCVDITYPIFDQNGNRTLSTKRRLVCKSIQINLYNPEQNTYTIGIPNDAIDFEYGQKKKTGRASTTAAAGGAERPSPPPKRYELDFDKAARYLYWFYYTNNWGTIETAQRNHAYSWRTGGRGLENILNLMDKKPHNTFKAYGMPKHTWREYEEVEVIQYEPGYPEDDDHIVSRKNEYQWVEHTEFYHVLIDGISQPVRVMGRYITSPLQPIRNRFDQPTSLYFYEGVNPNGRDTASERNKVKWGYVYGFGWVENTTDAVAFEWADYLAKQYPNPDPSTNPIPALFHFPNLFGRYVEQSGLSDVDSANSPDTGSSNTGMPDSNGVITYYDENGNPSAQIFPDSGRASYGPAIEHYNPETGEVVQPNPDGTYPEGTETRQMRDPQTGTPIFFTTINTPLYDSEGNVIVEAGAISTTDIQLPGIASFKTEIAVINNLISERATIGQLRAFEAILGDSAHEAYDENGNFIGYEGTQIETNVNNAITVSGIFEKDSNGHIKTDPVTGKPKIIKGGATVVYPNGSEHGLWDKGELQAGIFTWHDTQTNDYVTGIKGDRVILGGSGTLTADDLNSWAKNPSNNKGGVFAKYVISKRITVGEIEATDDSVEIIGNLQVDSGTAVFGTFGTVGQYTQITRGNIYSKYYNVQAKGNISFSGGGHGAADYSIGHTDAAGLKDTLSHVAVTQDASTDICTLWYLPSNIKRTGTDTNPPTGSSSNNWVNAGTFRKAASSSSEIYLYGSWSSGVPSVFTAYTTNLPDRYGAHIKEFNIVFDNQNVEAYDHLTVNHGTITVNANNTIDIPITVDSIEYSDGGADDDQYITRYSKTITGIDVSSVVASVGVKYLGSYTPSGSSEPIHAVVPTTDGRKYDYIEISVDEGSLVNSGTTSGYRRVKVNATGNGQATPTAIKEWRITDYGDGYSAVTVTSVGLADNLTPLGDTGTRTSIYIQGTASNGAKKDDTIFTLAHPTTQVDGHYVVNLRQGSDIIGRINTDTAYNTGKHDATLTTGDWRNGIITISNTDNSDNNVSIYIPNVYVTIGEFSTLNITWNNGSGTGSLPIYEYRYASNGSYQAIDIGRSVVVNINANTVLANSGVKLQKTSWREGKRSFDISKQMTAPDPDAEVYISLAAGTVTANTSTKTFSVPILDGSLSTGFTASIDASSYLETRAITKNGTYTPSNGKIGMSQVSVNVPVVLDTSYTPAGSTNPIKAVVPSTTGSGDPYLRIWYSDTGRQGTGENTTRTIDFKVGINTIESLNITDYADGYRAGQGAAVIPDLNDRWNNTTHTHEVYAGSKTFTTTFGGSDVTANRYMDVTLGDITVNSSTSISVPVSVNSVDYGTGGDEDQRTPRYTTTINKNISGLLQNGSGNASTTYYPDVNYIGFSSFTVSLPEVGVKYLGSYTPSGASEPIHAVVPTTDSGKYNYIEISVDEGSLVNEGTANGYRRVKVNAAGNGQTTPTAIQEWRITDYGDGYSAVTVTSVALADDLDPLGSTGTRTSIRIQGTASNGAKKDNTTFTLIHPTTQVDGHYVVNLRQGSDVIGRINTDTAYNAGWDYGAGTAFSTGATKITSPTSAEISSATQLDANAYYTINIKGKNHDNSNADGTDFIVKTPAAPQIQIDARWSNGTYTVTNGSMILASTTLSSQMTASGNPTQCTASGATSTTEKYVKQNYIINYENGNDVTSTEKIVTAIVNASSVFDAGFDTVAAPSFEKWTSQNVTTDITSNTIWFETDDKKNSTNKIRHGSRNVYLTGGTDWSGTTTKTTKVYLRDDSATGSIVGQLTITAPDAGGYTGLSINSSSGKVIASTTSATTEVNITVTKPTMTYVSSAHRYIATANAKADSFTMDTKTSDLSGDEAYGDGWDAGGATAWMDYTYHAPSTSGWTNASGNSHLGFGQQMCIRYRKYDGSYGYIPAYWKTPPYPTTIKPYTNRAHVPAPVAAGVLSGTYQYWNFIAYDDSNNQLYDIQTNQSSNGFVIEPYDYSFNSNGTYVLNEAVRNVTVNVTLTSDDIDIPTNYIYTTDRTPQGQELTRMRNLIRQAVKDGDSVVFRVDAGGASRYYNLQF